MNYGGIVEDYGKVKDKDKGALEELEKDYAKAKLGLAVVEVAAGFRLQNEKKTGPWLRELLEKGKPNRLSKPALETLSIVAYRQPCTRSEIEAVRGVAVDAMVRNLLEMGLLKVSGRSDLPGRPWLFGTTQLFLEHFGLKSLDELPNRDELRRQGEQLSMHLAEKEGGEQKELTLEAEEEEEDKQDQTEDEGDLSPEDTAGEEVEDEITEDEDEDEDEFDDDDEEGSDGSR